jgi:hypothetical protein
VEKGKKLHEGIVCLVFIMQDMLEKNHIKKALHETYLDDMKVLTENARANWVVEANIRITKDRLQNEFSNGHYRINEKIREVLR